MEKLGYSGDVFIYIWIISHRFMYQCLKKYLLGYVITWCCLTPPSKLFSNEKNETKLF